MCIIAESHSVGRLVLTNPNSFCPVLRTGCTEGSSGLKAVWLHWWDVPGRMDLPKRRHVWPKAGAVPIWHLVCKLELTWAVAYQAISSPSLAEDIVKHKVRQNFTKKIAVNSKIWCNMIFNLGFLLSHVAGSATGLLKGFSKALLSPERWFLHQVKWPSALYGQSVKSCGFSY